MSHPRAPFVRERAPEWKAPLPSASVRDSPGSRLGLAPGTPGIRFGDVWGPGLTFISKHAKTGHFMYSMVCGEQLAQLYVPKTNVLRGKTQLCKAELNRVGYLFSVSRVT
jgi:hypothetical protein